MNAQSGLPPAVNGEMRALVDLARALAGVITDEQRAGALIARHVAAFIGDGVSLALIPVEGTELVRVGSTHCDHAPAEDGPPNGQEPPAADRSADHPSSPCAGEISYDLPGPAGRPITISGRSPIAAALNDGEPVVLSAGDSPAGQLALPETELTPWADRYGVSSLAVLPVRVQGRIAGVVTMTRDDGRPPYTEAEIAFAQALTDVAAVSLEVGRMLVNSTTALEELRQQNELMNGVSDAIIACDETCAIINWSQAAERMYQYEEGEVLGCDLFALLGTEFATTDGRTVTRDEMIEELRTIGSWHGALCERRADGVQVETVSSLTALTGLDGRITGMVSVNRDVTEQRQKEYLASHDALTSLSNRRGLFEKLNKTISRCRQEGGHLAVLFFDLDRFKPINDTLGHKAGDEVLCITAERLARTLRQEDFVGRLGGDEFVAVAQHLAHPEEAELLAQRLLDAVSEPIVLGGRTVSVTSSVGIVVTQSPPADTDTPDRLLRAADSAMYKAKQSREGNTLVARRPPDFAA